MKGGSCAPAQGPARLIAAVAIERLLDRLPDVELAVPVEELTWWPGPFHRALAALPVRFPPTTVPERPAAAPLPQPRPTPSAPMAPPVPSADRGTRSVWSALKSWWRGE